MAGNRTLQARRITRDVPEAVLLDDLERYRVKAIELGATDAQIVRAGDVVVDERVRMKCLVPRCHLVGESPNCQVATDKAE